MKWLNGIQTSSSLLFFLKIVRSRVSCEHGEAARRETLVSRLCRSTLSELAKTRHVTSDAIQEVQWLSRLSKHIYLHGKDFVYKSLNYASPIWNEMYLKEKGY